MRFAAPAWAALALLTGCVRFGYGPDARKHDGSEAGTTAPGDASTSDAGFPGVGGAGGADSGLNAPDGGAAGSGGMDAGRMLDSGGAGSGSSGSGAMDAGPTDSGAHDSGAMDSAAQDTGTTDAGTPDTPDPRWTEDCPDVPGVLFCDSFEDGLSKWDYAIQSRGTVSVSTTVASNGSHALRADTMASTSNERSMARQATTALGHRTSGHLWARFFYYLPSYVNVTQKLSVGVLSEIEDPWLGFSVLIVPTGIGIESRATEQTIGTVFPRDQWVCVEMHVQIDPSAGRFEFFLDGAGGLALNNRNTLPARGYTSFEVGVHYANFNQGPITAYADDVMLGTERLGCN